MACSVCIGDFQWRSAKGGIDCRSEMRVEINETSFLVLPGGGPGPVQVLNDVAGSYSGLSGH